jgi:hypothetical protein
VGVVVADEQDRTWEFVTAPPRSAPGVTSMVGYRALETPGEVHRGMPSSTLTFIVSLGDGVEAAESAETLPAARPNALYERILGHKAEIVRPLAETDYGAHEFAVRDPEGNLWSFGDYRGQPPPA